MTKPDLLGSERKPLAGARLLGAAHAVERFEVLLMVRRRAESAFRGLLETLASGARPAHLSREAYARQFGADPKDLAAVAVFAKQHGLTIEQEDGAARSVMVSGTVSQFNAAFAVDLQHYEHARGSYRGCPGPVRLPPTLQGVVTAVLGLDNRRQARTHFRFRPPIRPAAQGNLVSYLPNQVAALYKFPASSGAGQCIGLIELGGGYEPSDLQRYFSKAGVPVPTVVPIPVGQGRNQPTGDAGGPDGEVTLDIEVAGLAAPGARLAVYFTTNTDAGFIHAVSQAVHDTVNRPSVLSISWGAPESSWAPQSLQAFDEVLQAAATMGVTVCAASGDSGSSDGVSDRHNHVDFPASSPHVIACGGTSLHAAGNTITTEVVWNDGAEGGAGGGGISSHFPLPSWQQDLKTSTKSGKHAALQTRGVPDVAANADPATGYTVLVGGTETVVGGTSAVAPLWAALIARVNALRGNSVGFANATLYRQPAVCNDITRGNNGSFAATPGWDACTGLGSPDGDKIAAVF